MKTFLESLNAFYTEVDFDQYLEESRIFYETAMNEITSNLPDATFIDHMEVYFQREYDVYHLIPSLTLPKTMGFGPRFDNQAYNVFGAVGAQMVDDPTTLQMGFSDADDIRELSLHEFGHSFVNPILDSLPNHLIDSSKTLFPPVKEAMYWQGYNNWNGCVYEHFVRATELIIAEKTRPTSEFLALNYAYLVNRRFVYIPNIKSILEGYIERDITFREAVEESLAALIQLAHE